MAAAKADEVVLEAEVTNRGALALYRNLGFLRDKRLLRSAPHLLNCMATCVCRKRGDRALYPCPTVCNAKCRISCRTQGWSFVSRVP